MTKKQPLNNAKILLGLSGGIAIYKSADLIRRLTVDYGAEVEVVMTGAAQQFMTPLVFETLSGKRVYTEMFSEDFVGTRHIDLGKAADLVLVCPATANILAKAAHGIADDLLSSIIMANYQKTLFAPAMNVNMWQNPATQKNIAFLAERGMDTIQPAKGLLACNDVGEGKLAPVNEIIDHVVKHLKGQALLKEKKVVVTGGPTREKIDAVRFISNYSSGKMGLSLAKAAYNESASVHLITGPVNIELPGYFSKTMVESASDMLSALMTIPGPIDYLFMSAAIEDFIPSDPQNYKLKKDNMPSAIPITKADDLVAKFRQKHPETCIVGFSVEMEKGKENSLNKMQAKGLDYIVWNNPNKEGAGFGHDTNEVTIFSNNGQETFLPKASKNDIAEKIIIQIATDRK